MSFIQASKRLENVSTYYFANKLAEIQNLNAEGKEFVLNLGIGSPDLPPSDEVLSVTSQQIINPNIHGYQSYIGLLALRQAFSDWYKEYFSVTINGNDEVLPLMGSKEGIMHVSMAYLDSMDQVLIPNPSYPAYKMCTLLAGAVPLEFELVERLGWRPDLDTLSKLDLSQVKLMWLNYPNMPTGAQVDNIFWDEVIEFAIENNILICHDNPYSLILSDANRSIFQSEKAKTCSLELTSLSKNYNMAGWRVGAIIGDKTFLKPIITFKSNMDSGMFHAIQIGAIQALGQPLQWIQRLNIVYAERRKIAWSIFDLLGLTYEKNTAGLFVWGKINNKNSEDLSNTLLHICKVFITPGHIFGSAGAQYLRISLCSPTEDFTTALYRIQTKFNKKAINFHD